MTHLRTVDNITEQPQKLGIAKILARAFADDPSFEYIFSEHLSIKALTAFYEHFVADGIKRGQIVVAEPEQGACIWYPASVAIFNHEFEAILNEVSMIISPLLD